MIPAYSLPAPNPRATLREFAAFVRRPRLLQPVGLRARSAWPAWGVLVGLHIAVLLVVLLPLTIVAQKALGLAPPDAFDKISSAWLLPITLLIAPVIEELLFRGWQTGRPRALWLLCCGIGAAALLYSASHRLMGPLGITIAFAGLVAATLAGWFALRRHRAPVPGFDRIFPAIYWIVALAFASAHLLNYASPHLLTAVLVLPQLWAGIVLGFTRQRFGLPFSMAQHILANASVIALAQITP